MEEATRPVLLVAHPGHELRLWRWMQIAKPLVFFLTDGSGSAGPERISLSRKLVREAGCQVIETSGRFTDREIYRDIMTNDVAPLLDITLELSETIDSCDRNAVVSDSCEFYNPAHDLVRVIADLIIHYRAASDMLAVAQFDYAVVGSPHPTGAPGEIVVTLSDEALVQKLERAVAYHGVDADVASALSRNGREPFRYEALRPAQSVALPAASYRPYYEQRGHRQVSLGRYREVLRYGEHFLPLVAALRSRVDAAVTLPVALRATS